MSNKLQGFYIMKFDSSRLSKSKFKITTTISDARKNGELIKLADSTLLEVVRRITKHPYNYIKLKELEKSRKKISKQENRESLLSILSKIDEILFIEHLVSVQFKNKTHYKKIYEKGLFINGHEYVRILAGAAQLRKQIVFFIRKDIYESVMDVLNCGRNLSQKLNPAKWSAYFGLYNSSGHKVSFPKFIVIKDSEYSRSVKMDWINDDNSIIETEKEVVFSRFDGQGLISPKRASIWAKELGLNWIPSNYIIRFPFGKGMVAVFDFHDFGEYVARENMVRDVWGDWHDINDIDLVISQSQFKLWDSYPNLRYYIQQCQNNDLGFRITRYSQPLRNIKEYSTTNYMFLQVLNLNKKDVEDLCFPTIEHFYSLMGGNRNEMLAFLYPDNPNVSFESVDPQIQALMLDDEFSKEPSIQKKFVNSLRKQIRDSYLGNIFTQGNYQTIVADPYSQCEHLFNMDVIGLLDEHEHYCSFWNEKNISEVATARSPLTHSSEMNLCKLKDGVLYRDWYQYLDNTFIINTKGIDTMIWADGDMDGDILYSTSNKIIINGIKGGLPISYDKPKAEKFKIDDDNIFNSDLFSFNSHIGFITNVSSTFHCMIENFEKGSNEHVELENRLKILRCLQGSEIDSAKLGGYKKPIPSHWTKWQRKEDSMSEEEKQQIDFDNSLIADKRPRFFRHLYSHLSIEYRKKNFEKNFWARQFGKSFDELVNSDNLSKEELDGIDYYKRRFPFIENDSVMNMVEETMFNSIKENQIKLKKEKFDYGKILKKRYPCEWVEKYYKQYKYLKRVSKFEEDSNPLFNIAKTIKENIYSDVSANSDYVLDCVIRYFYEEKKLSDTQFVWIFGDEIIDRLKQEIDFYVVPEKVDKNGDFNYLWSKYKLKKVSLEKMSEEKI